MTTVNQVQTTSRSQALSPAQAATLALRQAQLDQVSRAQPLYSDAKGAPRSYASDPLFGLEPDEQASNPGHPPLTSNRAFTLFDAIKSIGVLFNAEAAIGEGTMNMMQTVSSLLMHQLDQQQTYQNDIASINKSIKADQPPLIERIFEDIFMVGLGSALAFVFGGPAAGIAAIAVGGFLDFASQAQIFGSGDNKQSLFGELLGKLPEGEQIAAKMAISAALAMLIGGGALLPVEGVADAAVDGGEEIELQEMGGEEAEQEQVQAMKQWSQMPNAGGRFLALTISNLLTNGSKIDSALSGNKLKDGSADKTQLGLWGDIFKSVGASDALAGGLSSAFVLLSTVAVMGFSGKVLGAVPSLETGLMQKLMPLLQSVLALGSGATSLYQGIEGFKLSGVLSTEADVVFQLDQLQKELQSTEYMQHLGEQLNNRAISLNTSTMNTVLAVLSDFQSAVGLNQAV